MKKIIKDYFTFSAKETTAFVVLLLLIAGFIILPPIKNVKNFSKPDDSLLKQQLASTNDTSSKNETTDVIVEETKYSKPEDNFELFNFDPNTLDEQGWKRLGLREKTIKTIINYRSKGGKFRQPEDIRKIWGLREEEANRIIPYAVIEQQQKQPFNSYKQELNVLTSIDINTADIKEWQQLPFTDKTMPYRILKYRDKLGGFISINQIKEAYGMTDSVFLQIQSHLRLENISVHKININQASDYELSLHPYIPKNIAKAITIYREQHGAYSKLEDIKKIVFVKEDAFNKMAPYLTVD